jgi:hypothetical protein
MTRSEKLNVLKEYSEFLTKNGYMDTDWKDEQPYAIEEFMNEHHKIKFRLHCGGLKESMDTVQTFKSKMELVKHIEKSYNRDIHSDLIFEYIGFDTRVKWETYYVKAKFKIDNVYFIAGMSDGEF